MTIYQWLLPDQSLDEISKKEISLLLMTTLKIIPIISIIIGLIHIEKELVEVGLLIISIAIVSIFSMFILSKGYIHGAMLSILLWLLSVTTYAAINTYGIHSTITLVFPVIVLFSSLIMNNKGVMVITSIVIVCLGLIVFFEQVNTLHDQDIFKTKVADLIITLCLLAVNFFVTYNFSNITKRALSRAKVELQNQEEIKGQIEQSLSLKQQLMREVHHRVKNSLSMINSLIEIESYSSSSSSNLFLDLRNSVQTIGRAHDPLYHSEDYKEVAIKPYLEKLILTFSQSSKINNIDIDIEEKSIFHEKALSMGIILQEALSLLSKSNCQHANVQLAIEDSHANFIIRADQAIQSQTDLEPMMIQLLIEELNGNLTWSPKQLSMNFKI